MTPAHKKPVRRTENELASHHEMRQRAARVVAPIFGPETMAKSGDRAVRSERHDLVGAFPGGTSTLETIQRAAEPTAEDELKSRVAAPPKACQKLVQGGVPVATAELFALVLSHHAANQQAVKLSPGGVAGMLGMRQDDAAKVLADLIIRGLVVPVTNVFGGTAGYRPDPK